MMWLRVSRYFARAYWRDTARWWRGRPRLLRRIRDVPAAVRYWRETDPSVRL